MTCVAPKVVFPKLDQIPQLTLVLLTVWLAATFDSQAAQMRDDVPSIQYEQYSTNFAGQALWMRVTRPDNTVVYGSAFCLNGRFALTAAHGVVQNGVLITNLSVGTSASYLAPETGEVRQIVRVLAHPSYTAGADIFGSSKDLALIQFDQPLPAPTVRIGSVQIDDTITGVGYGYPATPFLGYLPIDGKRRAYQMGTEGGSFGTISGNYPFYYRFYYDPRPSFWPLPLAGAAMPGDSGSGMFNSAGELVAIAVGGFPSYPYELQSTFSARLDLSKDWILTNSEPQISITRISESMLLTWNAAADGCHLQTSSNLTTWSNLVENLPGAGTFTDPIANRPQQFYRLSRP